MIVNAVWSRRLLVGAALLLVVLEAAADLFWSTEPPALWAFFLGLALIWSLVGARLARTRFRQAHGGHLVPRTT